MVSIRYMLDTNTVSYVLKGKSPGARAKMEQSGPEADLCISAVTEAEVRYGLAKRNVRPGFRDEVNRFLDAIEVFPWDSGAARVYGTLRADLERTGKSLANLDLMIASHALSLGCVLVTNDRAFRNVGKTLQIVNWADDLANAR